MWHVDDGALHAYLDGALDELPASEAARVREHLEACPECSARLADERRVREEAHDILGLAAPAVEVPSLEELRAYVRAQAPRRSRVSVRIYRLGWAASVVLALGTGWLLRGGVPPTMTATPSGLDPSAAAARESFRADGATAADAASSVELEQQSPNFANEQTAATGAPAAVGQAAPAEPRRELVESLDEVQVTGAGGGAALLADAADADDGATKVAEDLAADALAADARPSDARRAVAEPSASPQAAPATPDVELAAAGNRARQDAASRDAEPAQRAAEQRLTSAISQAPAAQPLVGGSALGRGAGADAARAETVGVDTISLVVPGLEVLDVLRVGQGTTFAGMRALQRLPAGDTLETVHLPAGVDPASLPPLRAGWSQVVRARGDGWIVMRAPLAENLLMELLQRLEAGR